MRRKSNDRSVNIVDLRNLQIMKVTSEIVNMAMRVLNSKSR
jgi:hypothetical protein